MAVSKRVRFEVFKRDGFTCQYCGRRPPAVVLQIDHVLASSTGGSDDPANLVTACEDCNGGKSNVPLCQVPPTVEEQMRRRQEVAEQVAAFNDFLAAEKGREDDAIDRVADQWFARIPRAGGRWTFADARRTSCRNFLRRMPLALVLEAVEIAAGRVPATLKDDGKRWRYFCGVCWNMIRDAEGG